jgi:hypothetical protein
MASPRDTGQYGNLWLPLLPFDTHTPARSSRSHSPFLSWGDPTAAQSRYPRSVRLPSYSPPRSRARRDDSISPPPPYRSRSRSQSHSPRSSSSFPPGTGRRLTSQSEPRYNPDSYSYNHHDHHQPSYYSYSPRSSSLSSSATTARGDYPYPYSGSGTAYSSSYSSYSPRSSSSLSLGRGAPLSAGGYARDNEPAWVPVGGSASSRSRDDSGSNVAVVGTGRPGLSLDRLRQVSGFYDRLAEARDEAARRGRPVGVGSSGGSGWRWWSGRGA